MTAASGHVSVQGLMAVLFGLNVVCVSCVQVYTAYRVVQELVERAHCAVNIPVNICSIVVLSTIDRSDMSFSVPAFIAVIALTLLVGRPFARESRYQKVKTNLDFTEARDSE